MNNSDNKDNNKKNPSLDETVEMLDFDLDSKVSEEIDEILDFTTEFQDISDNNRDDVLNSEVSENKVEIDVNKEKLDDYKPSIKNFNIKSFKTYKIVKKVMLYVIIVMLLGFEFFITKAGSILNNIRVYASDSKPIRISQNERYGYIDNLGNKLVNPKYLYAEEFKGFYAIVKNTSNLPLIIDKGGKEEVESGTYFSLYRAEKDIIASKKTKKGLKYGILSSDLKEKTPFIYDSISYKDNVYSYVKENTVGLINMDGKDIYKYKLTDKDEKVIDVDVSPTLDSDQERYAVVKVNSSSQIVNIKSGKKVSNYTLNKIVPDENNVFYEVYKNNSKTYFYVYNDKVLLESDGFSSMSIPSIKAGVIRTISGIDSYNYISVKTLSPIKKDLKNTDAFYGDNIFVYADHDYRKNINTFYLIKDGEIYKQISGNYSIYKPFKNGFMTIKYDDGTYGYVNENGEVLTEEKFIDVKEFDSYGDAIVKTSSGYGVINKDGKMVIKAENSYVKMASGAVKLKTISDLKNVFYAVKENDVYHLYNKNGNKVNNKEYYDVDFNKEYPIIKVSNELEDKLILTKKMRDIKLTSYNTKYRAYSDYIIIKNEYYNYNGKMIYKDNEKKGDDNNG